MIYVVNKLSDLVMAKSCKNNIEKGHWRQQTDRYQYGKDKFHDSIQTISTIIKSYIHSLYFLMVAIH